MMPPWNATSRSMSAPASTGALQARCGGGRAPFDAGADMYRDVAFHGGIMALGFPANWWTAEIRANYRLGKYGPADNVGLWDLPWNVMHHPTCDEFWRTRDPDLSKIKVPVYS